MELFGSVTRNPSPSVAQWTFNTGTTSAARLASSNVSAGLTVTALQMNPKADDVGVDSVPDTVNDGFGFGGNSGEQVMFFHRANYTNTNTNTSTTPTPRPEGRFTTWGGPNLAAGVDTTVDNSPMSFTVTESQFNLRKHASYRGIDA